MILSYKTITPVDASVVVSGRFPQTRMPDGTADRVETATGPGASPVYSTLAATQIPALDAAKVTTGRFGVARLPDGTLAYFLKAAGAGVDPAYALLAATDIPALDAAKITSGVFNAARIPALSYTKSATNTYVGNQVQNRAIAHGLGATPSLVLLYDSTNTCMGLLFPIYLRFLKFSAATVGTSAVVTIADATNFYVGDNADWIKSFNQTPANYTWVAFA